MNSAQRRKAYRSMPKIGTSIVTKNGRVVTVIGRMHEGAMAFHMERSNVPSVHRIKVIHTGGSISHPVLSQTRPF